MQPKKIAKSVVFTLIVVSSLASQIVGSERPRYFPSVPTQISRWFANLRLPALSSSSRVDSETAAALRSIQGAKRPPTQDEVQAIWAQVRSIMERALESAQSSLVRTIAERFFVREISLEQLNEDLPVSPYAFRLKVRVKKERKVSSNQLKLIGKKFPNIVELDLSGASLRDEGFRELAQQPFASRLTHLNISHNGIRWEAMRDYMSAFISLTSLDISSNILQDAILIAIAQQPFVHNLNYLNISFAGILLGRRADLPANGPRITYAQIEKSMHAFKSLKRLDISRNSILNGGLALLAQSPFARHLSDLIISNTGITAEGLSASIGAFTGLTVLDVSTNNIGDKGLAVIAEQPFASDLSLIAKSTGATQELIEKIKDKFREFIE